jgi:hypothetical protein
MDLEQQRRRVVGEQRTDREPVDRAATGLEVGAGSCTQEKPASSISASSSGAGHHS